MTSKRRKGLFTLAVLLFALSERALESDAQLSGKGIAANEHVGDPGNKFLSREADLNLDGTNESDEASSFPKCWQNVEMRWMAEVSSSVYATPLITDLFSDGHKDVVVPSFVHYLEVLEGDEGVQMPGWPAFHKSLVHASPLLYDIDFDGTQEILLATYNGEILFFRETGELVESHKMLVPRLRVRKDWFAGLAADHVDHSQPDVGADVKGADGGVAGQGGAAGASRRRTLLQQEQASDAVLQQEQQQQVTDLLQSAENRNEQTAESLESMQLFEDYGDLYDAQAQVVDDGRGGNADGLGVGDYNEDPAFMHDPNDPLLFLDYEDQFLEHQLRASGSDKTSWQDEEYKQAPHKVEGGYLYVDSHILCNPTIADLDGNGHDELIVAVSYFFDRDYYGEPSHKAELGEDVDVSKYVASGVIVFDLPTRTVKWSQHLDLSTDQVRYRAFAYSPPTAADLDGDGKLEVLLGTSVGFLYVLGHDGQLREGWPVLMGEIQGQVLAADVNNDGRVEVFAGDSRGSVALFTADGKEIWEQHLRSMVAQGATLADVNGDGQLEIVFGTAGGFVYALNALTGHPIAGFPFKTHGRVLAPVLAVQLEEGPGLHLVVMSFDGHLYMISGSDACADVVDIGEPSYSMVLAEDLDGNGRMDLLVSTMNGVLYSFETASAYQPLKSWTSQYMGPGAAARSNWAGIYATEASRRPQDMKGSSFLVQFIIKDDRPPLPLDSSGSAADAAAGNATAAGMRRGPYSVRAVLQGVGVGPMNSGEQPVIGMSEVFAAPGQYQLELPCPLSRTSATILLEMRDSAGLVFSDSYALSFHYHFHKLFKWLLVGPLATMLVLLLAFRHVVDAERLPS